jgi:tetratricopeptide (TPR) repeat protein
MTALLAAAEAPAAATATGGLPAVKVQDLHYGDVLFQFYQHEHFDALVRLAAYREQGRLTAHARDAELLRGGLYLSLGQHREARRIFEDLLADRATPPAVRDQAWFWLGKVLYASGLYADSERALRAVSGALPGTLEPERRMLLAQGLMYRERFDEAIAALEGWTGAPEWTAYAQFNLGVALVRAGREQQGLQLLDAVGQLVTENAELVALRDKANVAIGYAHLQGGRPAAARLALDRVQLAGSQSSKALLGAGWADAAEGGFQRALVPWLELHERAVQDGAVQESFLAVPYAYAELGAIGQAVDYYEQAIASYDAERVRIDESIAAIREGRLLQAALATQGDGRQGWFAQLVDVPDSPESRYLYHLMAGHEFQEGLKSYRALDAMSDNLSRWQDSLGAFDDMVATREQALTARLPAAESRLAAVDVGVLNRRRDGLRAEFEAAVVARDVTALATEREREWLALLDAVDAELAAHPGDAALDDAREKARLARGVLMWRLDEAWKMRRWQTGRSMRELDAAVYDARTRQTGSARARQGAPERNAVLRRRVVAVSPRVAALAARVESAKAAQELYLAGIAIDELESQRRRLDEYSVQARYAVATIYDRASAQVPPP